MDVVVALDTGTTATKAVAVAVDGAVVATADAGYSLLVPRPGHVELDAARLQAAAVEALAGLAERLPSGSDVIGLCLSAAMHGLVPLDDRGNPLGNLITWADSRADDQAVRLRESSPHLHARTGTPIHPMSPLAKLVWLQETDPDLLASTPRWGGVKELVIAALTESALTVDLSCASATGMYDIHERRWDPEALELAGVTAAKLAEVVNTTDIAGPLRPAVASKTGLPAGIRVVAGASDGPLGNLGLGAISSGIAAITLGTSGAMRAVRANPAVDPDGRLFCYALTEDKWVLGGPVNNAGSVVRWASVSMGAVPADTTEPARWTVADIELLAEAKATPPGSEGLLCLPYLLGERAPWWTPGLAGAYIGLRRDHGRGHMVRAAVEGVCQQFAFIRDALRAADVAVEHVRVTGGAVQSDVWCETLAAALGMQIGLAESAEGTGIGAGLLGHYALGTLSDLDEASQLIHVDRVVEPDPRVADIYQRMRPLVERCTRELADVFRQLERINESVRSAQDARQS